MVTAQCRVGKPHTITLILRVRYDNEPCNEAHMNGSQPSQIDTLSTLERARPSVFIEGSAELRVHQKDEPTFFMRLPVPLSL